LQGLFQCTRAGAAERVLLHIVMLAKVIEVRPIGDESL
jgi:hypothetical protein